MKTNYMKVKRKSIKLLRKKLHQKTQLLWQPKENIDKLIVRLAGDESSIGVKQLKNNSDKFTRSVRERNKIVFTLRNFKG